VVIPVYAAGPESVNSLKNALYHLKASTVQDFEIVVVDDGSPSSDAVSRVAGEAGAGVVRLDQRRGPAAARNAGAREAVGDIVIFLDADTSVHPDTLERFARKFSENPQLDAAMGSYDQLPTAPGAVSRFRNLLHSFFHHSANGCATTFWAGCGAVRKDRFRALGGFDESFHQPAVEDVEFGLRLSAAGGAIQLDPQIQVTHHKSWSLGSMVWTDFFARAIPWARILYKYPMPAGLNFKVSDRMSVALAALTLLFTVVALLHGGHWWVAPVATSAVIAALNWRLFRFLVRAAGYRDAVLGFPLLFVYLVTCAVGLIGGIALAEHRRDRWLWPSAALIGLVLLALQVSGGAYRAEFTGHPDEAAQFVSGLMVYDYLTQLPPGNPIAWAGQYYLHYPKVAIGHWPPAYQLMEAVWWLFVGPSRITAMLLQWLIGAVALTMLYRLARSVLSLPVAVAIVALTIAAPVFQESLEQTMADLGCLLWGVLVMHGAIRLVDQQDRTALFLVVFGLLAAVLTKGTGLLLAPVPLVALLASRKPIHVPARWLLAGAACLLGAAAWYWVNGGIRAWGGMSWDVPWPGPLIGHLAGWGFLALAAFGLRRNPLALVAGSLIVCMLGASILVRAMREERHWIVALPAILLLSGVAVSCFQRRWVAICLLLSAAALFPFARYRQSPTEFGKLARQLVLPSRMLVSSAGSGEGPWIAVASLAEHRPGSFLMRATKVLAETGWSGEGYHLLAETPAAVSRHLDELAVDIVILHTPVGRIPRPHHALLRDAVSDRSAWTPCGKAHNLLAYCRTKAPEFSRQPLRLKVYGWDFEERIRP